MRPLAICAWIALFCVAPAVAEARTSGTIIRWAKSGGIAGVSDNLRVRADGVAFATSGRDGTPVRARLSHKRLTRLRTALKAAHLETLRHDYPAPGAADTFVYSVTYQSHTVNADETKMPARLRKPVALLQQTFDAITGDGRFVDPEHAALAHARARWKRAHLGDYRFRLRVTCFCPDAGKRHTITVRDGRAHGSNQVEKVVDTVPKMFREIARTLDDPRAGDVTVRYDPDRGYPREVTLDRIKGAMDDELSWTADRLRAAP